MLLQLLKIMIQNTSQLSKTNHVSSPTYNCCLPQTPAPASFGQQNLPAQVYEEAWGSWYANFHRPPQLSKWCKYPLQHVCNIHRPKKMTCTSPRATQGSTLIFSHNLYVKLIKWYHLNHCENNVSSPDIQRSAYFFKQIVCVIIPKIQQNDNWWAEVSEPIFNT